MMMMAIIISIYIYDIATIVANTIVTHQQPGITMPSAQYPVPSAQIKLFPCSCAYCCVLCHWIDGDGQSQGSLGI